MHIKYAAIDGVVAHAGLRIKLNPGEAWNAEDSLVRARPDLFTDEPTHARTVTGHTAVDEVGGIERATARPGEKRRTRGPVEKRADKPAAKGSRKPRA